MTVAFCVILNVHIIVSTNLLTVRTIHRVLAVPTPFAYSPKF